MDRIKFLKQRKKELKQMFNNCEKATIEKKQKLEDLKKWNLPIFIVGIVGFLVALGGLFLNFPLWINIPNLVVICINLAISIVKDRKEENIRKELINLNLETICLVNELNPIILELEQANENTNEEQEEKVYTQEEVSNFEQVNEEIIEDEHTL